MSKTPDTRYEMWSRRSPMNHDRVTQLVRELSGHSRRQRRRRLLGEAAFTVLMALTVVMVTVSLMGW